LVETMMNSPNCPEHGRLVLDLALGRLDDDNAVLAEETLATCPVCRDWWQTQFEGEDAALVDEAVASVFDELQLPVRRRSHGWMAVAAAAVLTIGIGALWMVRDPLPVEPVVVERTAAIQVMDFEVPDLVPIASTTSSDLREESAGPVPVFVPAAVQVESDDEMMVAEATPPEEAIGNTQGALFAGGFESGSTTGWGVPSA
jgi:hypothetical protein